MNNLLNVFQTIQKLTESVGWAAPESSDNKTLSFNTTRTGLLKQDGNDKVATRLAGSHPSNNAVASKLPVMLLCVSVCVVESSNSIKHPLWLYSILSCQFRFDTQLYLNVINVKIITANSFMKTRVQSVLWLNWFWSWLTQQCEVIPSLIKGFIRAQLHPLYQLLRQSLVFCQPEYMSVWVCLYICAHWFLVITD